MVCGGRYLQRVLHPPVDVPVIQRVSISFIFTFQLKSLLFRGKREIFFGEKSVTHTFIFQPTQATLGIPGSHFELFPFTSYNLCSLNSLLNSLQANYFSISNYQSVCPSGSLIFPAYFFGFLLLSYLCVCLREKNLPAG